MFFLFLLLTFTCLSFNTSQPPLGDGSTATLVKESQTITTDFSAEETADEIELAAKAVANR